MWKIAQKFLLQIPKNTNKNKPTAVFFIIPVITLESIWAVRNENNYSTFWSNTRILADSPISNTIKTTSRICNSGKPHFCKVCDFFLVHSHKLGAKDFIFQQRLLKLPTITIKSLLTSSCTNSNKVPGGGKELETHPWKIQEKCSIPSHTEINLKALNCGTLLL